MIIYHNPRCSKSREALQWLTEHGFTPEIRLYLEKPLSLEEITQLKQKLNLGSIREILRQKESIYQELQLDNADENKLQAALLATPQLLERPIIVMQNGAVVARPLERLIQWLENTSNKA